MDNLQEELGTLRHEVRIGFIEVDNQFQSVNDKLKNVGQGLQAVSEEIKKVGEELNKTNEQVKKTQSQIGKVAKLLDNGFEVIQTFVDQKMKEQEIRLDNIENRLNKAGL